MNAYIIAGFRSAVGKAPRGKFRFTRPDDLAAHVVNHLVGSVPGLERDRIDKQRAEDRKADADRLQRIETDIRDMRDLMFEAFQRGRTD